MSLFKAEPMSKYKPAIDNRRLVLELRAGETLELRDFREIDFYADKVRTQSSSALAKMFS